MMHSRPYFGRNIIVFFFWDLEWGGRVPAAFHLDPSVMLA